MAALPQNAKSLARANREKASSGTLCERARRKASCAESFVHAAGQKEPFLVRGRVKVCRSAGNMDHFADAHTHFPLIAH